MLPSNPSMGGCIGNWFRFFRIKQSCLLAPSCCCFAKHWKIDWKRKHLETKARHTGVVRAAGLSGWRSGDSNNQLGWTRGRGAEMKMECCSGYNPVVLLGEREREREVVCCFIYRFISSCIYFDLDIYLSIWIAYTHAWRVLFSYWHLQVDHVAHPRPHARKECSCLRQRTCWVPRMHRGVIDEVCMKSEVCGVRCQGNNPNSWTTSRQYLKGPGGDGSRACPAWPNRNCGWLWPVEFRRNEQGIHQRICSQNDLVWRTSNTCSLFASRCVSVCAWNNNFACLPPEIQPRTISNQ